MARKNNRVINNKGLKMEFNNHSIKIGKDLIRDFIILEENKIKEDIAKLARRVDIFGKKVVRKEDFDILFKKSV